eukprot:8096311-Lingulodinium_polyedra.AAC.1
MRMSPSGTLEVLGQHVVDAPVCCDLFWGRGVRSRHQAMKLPQQGGLEPLANIAVYMLRLHV